jgi:2-dehydro-3-deoxyphosphooctonate aldolase (KDO 8-P synthase)
MAWSFGRAPFLIAGPCVIEPGDVLPRVAEVLARIALERGLPVCFKASFDKANRARLAAARGPGLEEGLRTLERVRAASGLPVLTDIHEAAQAAPAAAVADALQIPAFLCRQTDLLVAAGATGKPVNVKKGQWIQAEAMAGALEKVRSAGSRDVAVTERGTFFGYGDLVVDMRNFARLREATGAPVIFDATHSVQQPGQGGGGASGGQREFIPPLLAAAAAAGADGFFIETHPDPARALSDAATQWPLDRLDELLERTLDLWFRARDRAPLAGRAAHG